MTTKNEYADLYLRVSIDRAGKSAIERQEMDCRAWIAGHQLKVRSVHIDRGRSGYLRGVGREGLGDALTAVSSGVVGTLVVWKLDRLSREGIGQVGKLLQRIDAAGGRLVSIQDSLDTAVSTDRQLIETLAELARSESENLSLRVRSAKQYLRSQGRWRYLSLNDELARRIQDLSQALATTPAPVADTEWLRDPVLLRAKWSAATVQERRELLKLAMDEIRVSQGRRGARFVPGDRLTIGWAVDRVR